MTQLEEHLLKAQRHAEPFYSTSCPAISSITEAYQVQRRVFHRHNTGLAAWKLGRLSDASVFCAPIYAADVYQHGAILPDKYHNACHVEAEVAFKLRTDIASDEAVTLDSIGTYFDEVCSAIEILDSRFSDWATASDSAHLADRQMNGALALGPAQPISSLEDYRKQRFSLEINGQLVCSAQDNHPEQSIAQALYGFVKQAQTVGYHLQRNSWVTTGTWSGYPAVQRADQVTLQFSKLGKVSITL